MDDVDRFTRTLPSIFFSFNVNTVVDPFHELCDVARERGLVIPRSAADVLLLLLAEARRRTDLGSLRTLLPIELLGLTEVFTGPRKEEEEEAGGARKLLPAALLFLVVGDRKGDAETFTLLFRLSCLCEVGLPRLVVSEDVPAALALMGLLLTTPLSSQLLR